MLTNYFFRALQISASYCTTETSKAFGRVLPVLDFAAHLASDLAHLEVQS